MIRIREAEKVLLAEEALYGPIKREKNRNLDDKIVIKEIKSKKRKEFIDVYEEVGKKLFLFYFVLHFNDDILIL